MADRSAMKTRSANPSDNDLGSFIRARRLREGLTLTAAADAAEVVKGHMSQIENGKRAEEILGQPLRANVIHTGPVIHEPRPYDPESGPQGGA